MYSHMYIFKIYAHTRVYINFRLYLRKLANYENQSELFLL